MNDRRFARIKKLYHRYEYDRKVQQAFFEWAIDTCEVGVVVEFQLPTLDGFWRMDGKKFRKVISSTSDYLIYVNGESNLDVRGEYKENVFFSDFLCIAARQGLKSSIVVELSRQEIREATSYIRALILQTLSGNVTLSQRPASLTARCGAATVDVVLWVGGQLRGSIISVGFDLEEALRVSALRSLRDYRFKPLELEELDELTITITLISNLHIPLPRIDCLPSMPLAEVTHIAKLRGRSVAWYVPTVYLQRRFKNYENFLESLLIEKGGKKSHDLLSCEYFFAITETYIEERVDVQRVDCQNSLEENTSTLSISPFLPAVRDLASWLCHLQDKSGFFPQQISPYVPIRKTAPADWVRMAFVAHALYAFGVSVNDVDCQRVAQKTYKHVYGVFSNEECSMPHKHLVASYLLQYCTLASENQEVLDVLIKYIEPFLRETDTLSTIAVLQIVTALIEHRQEYVRFKDKIDVVAHRLFDQGLMTNDLGAGSLAAYAQLYPVALRLRDYADENSKWALVVEAIGKWLRSAQHEDGSFPNSYSESFSYTRGTGKVFEVLALESENRSQCIRALEWLLGFQYTEQNSYFILPRDRELFYGSLKHDAVNASAWIDAAGHTLLGVARLLKIHRD